MTRYIVRRILGAIPLVLAIATLIFLLVHLAPGDATSRYIHPGMTAETMARIRANLGLDRPLIVQYLLWMKAMLTGDFGQSFQHALPVRDLFAAYLPRTLTLTSCALVLSFALGIVVGTAQAVRRGATDSVLSVVLLFFYSMPSFWLAIMLALVFGHFAVNVWGWPIYFPASGVVSVDHDLLSPVGRLLDRLWHLALPVTALSLVLTAGIARYMRGGMLEAIGQDFVRTARAKGLRSSTVVYKHALRNALLPIVTLLGLYIPMLIGGTVFIEYVFAWPGMGRGIVDAITGRDYPVVMAGSFFFAVVVVLANLVADVLYAVVDPRIRYE